MNITRQITKLKRRTSHLKPYLLPGTLISITILATFTLLTLFSTPRPPRLKNGTGDKLYIASNKNFSTTVGKKDGTPAISFSRGESSVAFLLAGSASAKHKKDGNSIIFSDVLPSTDLKYTTTTNGLKEELIIKQYDKNSKNTYLFDLNLNQITPKYTLNNFIDSTFRDGKGNYLFHFEKPFAIDSSGNRTDDVVLQLAEDKQVPGQFSMKLIVDENWLSSPTRTYPIIIDPTIIHDTTTEFAAGTLNRVKDFGTGSSPRLESSYQPLPADEYTVGLWHMDESADNSCSGGQDACDLSGNGNHGTATGTTINTTTQKLGTGARTFNGSSDFINTGNSTTYPKGDFTLESWFKTTDNGNIIMISTHGTTNDWLYWFGKDTSNFLHCKLYQAASGTAYVETQSTQTINDGRWHHGACVVFGTTISVYIDGQLAGSSSSTAGTRDVATAGNMYIGKFDWTTTYNFSGTIDEVRLSNIARSPEEIKASASRRSSSVYTSPVLDLGGASGFVTAWNNLTWTELGVSTGDGETLKDSTGLVAQWNFNETSGTTATNNAGSCGASCNGTLTSFASTASQDQTAGTGWTANNRRWGSGALSFDGTNDTATVGNPASLQITGALTLEAWIKTSYTGNYQFIVAKRNSDLVAGQDYDLEVTQTSGLVSMIVSNGSVNASATSKKIVADGRWHHVVGTYIPSTSVNIYVDGKLENSNTTSIPAALQSVNNFAIGSRNNSAYYFNGTIDSSRIYSRALSASEIMSNYGAGNIEIQTRVGDDASPDDGDWDDWSATAGETLISNLDSDASNWSLLPQPTSQSSCKEILDNGLSTGDGIYTIALDGQSFSVYCDMTTNGGGWTLVANIAPADGGSVGYNNQNFWTGQAEYGTFANKFANDYKSPAAYKLKGDQLMIQSANTGAAGSILGWRSWPMLTKRTFHSFFTIGIEAPHATDSCETGAPDAVSTGTTSTWDDIIRQGTCLYSNVNPSASGEGDTIRLTTLPYNGTDNNMSGFASCIDCGTTWQGTTYPYQGIDRAGCNSSSCTYAAICRVPSADCLGAYCTNPTYSSTSCGSTWNSRFYVRELTTKTVSKTDESNIKTEGTGSLKLDNNVMNNTSFIDSNTVGLWHLDETGGTGAYIKDSTSNANHATPTGTTLVKGIGGKARDFNGSSDYVRVTAGSGSTLDLDSNPVTIEAWVKADTLASTSKMIVGRGDIGSEGFGLLLNAATGKVNLGSHGGGNFDGLTTIVTGKWYHVAGVVNGTNSAIYVNGVLDQTGTVNIVASNLDLYIGAGYDASAQTTFFDGSIDEVKVSKIARTAEEIANSYRLSRDNYINKTISATDLSSKTSLPLYIAADRPGTYLSATVGESSFANYQPDSNTVGLWHLDESTETARSCYSLRLAGVTTDGIYTIDPDGPGGNAAFQAYCNMTYDGGGWTMAVKSWYGSGMIGNVNAVGSVADATTLKGNAYKLSDTNIKNIIGPSNNFDLMGDQNGYNSAYSTGNYEYVVLRNYTGVWSYASAVAASTTTTSMQSYRISDKALAWSGNMTCGVGGAGINCSTLAVGNPQGGAGCIINMGTTSNTGWHHFYMNETNDDTYMYMCNGAQHSSSFNMNHRWWVRERNPIPVIKSRDAGNNHLDAINIGASTTQGQLGQARSFNGTSDYLSIADNPGFDLGTGNFTISFWANHSSLSTYNTYLEMGLYTAGILIRQDSASSLGVYMQYVGGGDAYVFNFAPQTNKWYYFNLVRSGTTLTLYVNGVPISSGTSAQNIAVSGPLHLGHSAHAANTQYLAGKLDEVRIDNAARTVDEIRQAYEVGSRTHNITIDFAANLDSGNLISSSGDLSFTVDATAYGLTSKGSMLFAGDKVIVKENYNGTEYLAQGTVTSVTESTGAVTIAAWDSGSTFPGSGFTSGATVFKWQREYWSVNGEVLDSHLDSVTKLSLRLTDGFEGRTIYLDDLKSSSGYLTDPQGSTITSNTGSRYMQYRAILNSWDEAVTATMSALTLDYTSNATPNTPTLSSPSDTATNVSLTPSLQTVTTDPDSDYLRYKIELCTNVGMSVGCQTFDQTSSQTDWSGQNAQTSTAYTSGTTATYSITSPLSPETTYYYHSFAIDPAGTNTWSSTQGSPYSFTTTTPPLAPSTPWTDGSVNPTGIINPNPEFSAIHGDDDSDPAVFYEIEVNTNNTFTGTVMWDTGESAMTSLSAGLRSEEFGYGGSALAWGTTYYWRIRFTDDLGATSDWSATQFFTMNSVSATPTLSSPSDTATNVSLTPTLQTVTTDPDSDYLRYKIELCTNVGMSIGCQTFDQTSSQTDWSGQNAQTNTAYTSGTTANYTITSPLSPETTYYYRSYAIDPAGTNIWSSTQGTPYSFTTRSLSESFACLIKESTDDSSLTLSWSDRESNETNFKIERSIDGAAFSSLQTLSANATSYQDSTISQGHTYKYRVAPFFSANNNYGDWCTTSTLSIQEGNFGFSNLNFEGFNFN